MTHLYESYNEVFECKMIFRNGGEIEADQEHETEVQEEISVIEVRHVMLEQDQSQSHAITSVAQVGRVVSVGGVQVDHVANIAVPKLIYAVRKQISEDQKWIFPIAIAKNLGETTASDRIAKNLWNSVACYLSPLIP